jgi:DNA repair exonuclease SbcCD ATPase subunit
LSNIVEIEENAEFHSNNNSRLTRSTSRKRLFNSSATLIIDRPSDDNLREQQKKEQSYQNKINSLEETVRQQQNKEQSYQNKVNTLEETVREQQKKEQSYQNKINELEETFYCLLCRDNPRTILFQPCLHLTLCDGCHHQEEMQMKTCPFCREKITSHLKIFVA